MDVEDNEGRIDVASTICVQQQTPHTHVALIAVFVLFLLVVVALMISSVRAMRGNTEINCEEH